MAILSARNARLQDTVKRREKEFVELENEMLSVQEKKEKDMKIIQKLVNSQELLKLELDREKQRVLSKTREVKEAQDSLAKLSGTAMEATTEVPTEVQEGKPAKKKKGSKWKATKEVIAKETAIRTAKKAGMREAIAKQAKSKEAMAKEAMAKDTMVKETMAKAAEEKELLLESDKAVQEKDRATERKEFQAEIKRLKKAEYEARQLALRLQQDLNQSGRSWKMKFEILKKRYFDVRCAY
nr:PREDICTED: caldesmon-like [Anolis carolinensis]|eukprot:XP_008110893.2 PREDICTED: caldesmon-like [Anolis carolinensis]